MQCPTETLSVKSSNSESVVGTRQQVTSKRSEVTESERIISMHVVFVPPSRFASSSTRKSCTCQLTPNVVYSRLDTVRFCCFLHESVPAIFPPVKSCVRLIRNTAVSVANGDRWPGKSTSLRQSHSTDLDWTRAFAHDGRDPRSWPQTKPCRGQHVLEKSYTANQHGA